MLTFGVPISRYPFPALEELTYSSSIPGTSLHSCIYSLSLFIVLERITCFLIKPPFKSIFIFFGFSDAKFRDHNPLEYNMETCLLLV